MSFSQSVSQNLPQNVVRLSDVRVLSAVVRAMSGATPRMRIVFSDAERSLAPPKSPAPVLRFPRG